MTYSDQFNKSNYSWQAGDKLYASQLNTIVSVIDDVENELIARSQELATLSQEVGVLTGEGVGSVSSIATAKARELINELVAGAPDALDTLKELADELAKKGDLTALNTLIANLGEVKSELQASIQEVADDVQELRDAVAAIHVKPTALSEFIDDVGFAKKTEVETELAKKQNVITDLETIRSNAALGATALQEHQSLDSKQDVIGDLETIRSGAALGATALQTHQDISSKQDVIEDLDTIRSNAGFGFTAYEQLASKANKGTTLESYGIEDAYTKSEVIDVVAAKITDVIAGAGDDFDTLKEIADWIAADETKSANIVAEIAKKQDVIDDLETIRQNAAGAAGTVVLKQDAISDLADIRAGAALGKTAVQPKTLLQYAKADDLLTKQDVIEDLEEIRSKAESALQEHQSLDSKQDVITDLETIRSGAALGATAIQAHQSLEGYATESWVEGKNYLTEHQSLEGKADKADTYTKTEVDTLVSTEVGKVLDNAPEAFDTLKEVADWIADDKTGAAALASKVAEHTEALEDIADIRAKANSALQEHQDISGKQDVIDDLADIRSKANSALQVHQSLDGYATEAWVEGKNYLTEHQSLDGKADKATTLSGYGIEDAYTKGEVDDLVSTEVGKVLDNAPEAFDTLKEVADWIADDKTGAAALAAAVRAKQDTISDLETIRSNAALGATAVQTETFDNALSTIQGQAESLGASVQNIATAVEGKADADSLYTKDEIDSAIASAVEGLVAEVPEKYNNLEKISNKLDVVDGDIGSLAASVYALENGKQDKIPDIEIIRYNAEHALQAHQSLEGYATESWVEGKKYLTTHQDISGKQDVITDLETIRQNAAAAAGTVSLKQDAISDLADIRAGAALGKTAVQPKTLLQYAKADDLLGKQDVIEDLADIRSKANSALQEHQSLAGYATEEWVDQKGFIKEHQSLEAYATKEWVESKNYLTSHQDISGKVDATVFTAAITTMNQTLEQYSTLITALNAKVETLESQLAELSDVVVQGFANDVSVAAEGAGFNDLIIANNVNAEDTAIEVAEESDASGASTGQTINTVQGKTILMTGTTNERTAATIIE